MKAHPEYDEEIIKDYFRLINKVFHDLASTYFFLKGGNVENITLLLDGPKLIGGSALIPDSSQIHRIEYFVIDPEHQKQGKGNELLSLLEEKVTGMIWCETRSAANFYRKNAYAVIGKKGTKSVMAKFLEK